MQDKFKFVYDEDNYPNDLDMILCGLDREAADIYHDWKHRLHKNYLKNVEKVGIARAR